MERKTKIKLTNQNISHQIFYNDMKGFNQERKQFQKKMIMFYKSYKESGVNVSQPGVTRFGIFSPHADLWLDPKVIFTVVPSQQ